MVEILLYLKITYDLIVNLIFYIMLYTYIGHIVNFIYLFC